MINKVVFVTGASGYLGKSLVRRLSNKGYIVICLVRESSKAKSLSFPNVKIIVGDVRDKATYKDKLSGVNAVFHLAAVVGNNNEKLNFSTHVDGAKNLIEAAKKNKLKRIIYVSTMSASYPRRSCYAESKLQAEKLFYSSGIPTTVIRPNLILGEDSPQLKKISALTRLPVIPVVGSGKKLIQPIDVEQLTDVLIKVLEDEKTINHTISISGSEIVTFNKFLDIISNAYLGKTKFKLHLPIFVCNILAAVFEKALKSPPITKGQIILINQDSVSSFADIKNLFKLDEKQLSSLMSRYAKAGK